MFEFLPPDQQLEPLLSREAETVKELLRLQHDTLATFTDISIEEKLPTFPNFIDGIVRICSGRDDDALIRVGYESFFLAYSLADLILEAKPIFALDSYLWEVFQTTDPPTKLLADVGEYLGERPHIDAMIGYFMPELDHTTTNNELAETVAGLALMSVDRGSQETFIAGSFDTSYQKFFI